MTDTPSEMNPNDSGGSAPTPQEHESVAAPSADEDAKPTKKDRRNRAKAPWWELPALIAIAVLLAVLVKSFLIQPFYIPSDSMERTLHGCPGCSGDRILVFKPVYDFGKPSPGDIIVFRAPEGWDAEAPTTPSSNPVSGAIRWFGQLVGVVPPDERDLVKRVIAVGGQTVQCCDANGNVQVSDNGTAGPWRSLIEPFVFEPLTPAEGSKPGDPKPGDAATFGPVTIPAGRLWVMGDHRSDSADSRWHCINEAPANHVCDPMTTTVPVKSVIGKAIVIAWPPSRWRTLGTPATFVKAAGAGASAAPLGAGLTLVLPIALLRRRRRKGVEPVRGVL